MPSSVGRRTRLIARHPSEWMRPRKTSWGYVRTMSHWNGSSTIRRLCFGPAPCCGNKQCQCFQLLYSSVQPTLRVRPVIRPDTSAIAEAQRSRMPGYFVSSTTRRRHTRFGASVNMPSPRYMPRRYAYASPRRCRSAHRPKSGGMALQSNSRNSGTGAAGGIRTHTSFRTAVFETALSTGSSTAASSESIGSRVPFSMIERLFDYHQPSLSSVREPPMEVVVQVVVRPVAVVAFLGWA